MPATAQQPADDASPAQLQLAPPLHGAPVPPVHDVPVPPAHAVPVPPVRGVPVPLAHDAPVPPVRGAPVPPVHDAPVPSAVVGHLKDSGAEVVEAPMVNAGAAPGLLLRSDLVPAHAFDARAGPVAPSVLVKVAARVDFVVPDLVAGAGRGSCPSAALAPDVAVPSWAADPSGTETHRNHDAWKGQIASRMHPADGAIARARCRWGTHSYQDVPSALRCHMQSESRPL